jgi:hypothetical protein
VGSTSARLRWMRTAASRPPWTALHARSKYSSTSGRAGELFSGKRTAQSVRLFSKKVPPASRTRHERKHSLFSLSFSQENSNFKAFLVSRVVNFVVSFRVFTPCFSSTFYRSFLLIPGLQNYPARSSESILRCAYRPTPIPSIGGDSASGLCSRRRTRLDI